MSISPFGWSDNSTPDITASNLELNRKELSEYADNRLEKATPLGPGELLGARTATPPAAHFQDIRDGTLASPAKKGVTISLSRTDATTRAEANEIAVGSDAPDAATAFRSTIKGAVGSQVQIVAGMFESWQTGESSGGEGSADATPLMAIARVTNNGVGRAIPLYLESSRETATSGGQQGMEIRVKNASGETDTYTAGAPPKSMGSWTNAQTGQVAAGHVLGHGFGAQFDVGYAINEGAVKSAGFRDDSNSENGLLIKGEHSKGAIKYEMTAGVYDPSALFKVLGNTSSHSVQIANGNRGFKFFLSGAVKTFLSDTAVGDCGIQFDASGQTFRMGTAAGATMLAVNQTEFGIFGKKATQQNPIAGEVALREALKAYGILV